MSNKLKVNVKIKNIEQLKNLTQKLTEQCEQVNATLKEIDELDLEFKVEV